MTDMEGIIDNLITPDDWVPVDSIIKVIGVGGGGCNAVDYMYRQKIEGCTFIVCNTDSQALDHIDVPIKIQLGSGLGAGCDPTKGRNAALDSQDVIAEKVLKSIAERVCSSNPTILNSHNLRYIYREIKRAGVILSLDIKELAFLTDFYFVRYPGEDYIEVDEEICEECVAVMKNVVRAVNRYRKQHNLYICEELSEKNK